MNFHFSTRLLETEHTSDEISLYLISRMSPSRLKASMIPSTEILLEFAVDETII